MLGLVSALALGAASGGAPAIHTPPKGSLGGLISFEDYPKDALQKEEQGMVEFKLALDATGAITDCVVTQSSGSASLDSRTCELIRARARFEPARDRRGRGVAVSFSGKVRWQIEENLSPSEFWVDRMVVDLSPDQRPVSCRYEFEGATVATRDFRPETCSVEQEHLIPDFSPITRSVGIASRVTMETRFEVGNGSEPTPPIGDVVLNRAVIALRISELGKIQSCQVITQRGPVGRDPCLQRRSAFEPRKGVDGKAAAFDATVTVSEYAKVTKPASR